MNQTAAGEIGPGARFLRVHRTQRWALSIGWKSQAEAAVVRRCWKHSRQKTGRPCVGLKGTVVSLPQPEQLVRVSTLGRVPEASGSQGDGRPFGLAGFATFGFVLELFVVEEQLFSGCKDEVSAAVNTLQNLVLEFHGELLPSARDPKPWTRVKLQLSAGPD